MQAERIPDVFGFEAVEGRDARLGSQVNGAIWLILH